LPKEPNSFRLLSTLSLIQRSCLIERSASVKMAFLICYRCSMNGLTLRPTTSKSLLKYWPLAERQRSFNIRQSFMVSLAVFCRISKSRHLNKSLTWHISSYISSILLNYELKLRSESISFSGNLHCGSLGIHFNVL